MSKVLQKLHDDQEVRLVFQEILVFLLQETGKPVSSVDVEGRSLQFDQQLLALTNLQRAIDVQDNETKIGHWCIRENEGKVKGMDDWHVYWLTLDGHTHMLVITDDDHEYPVKLTLWAVGKDDNSIQKAIKIWVETHFPQWEIESLKCVRR